ncbi:MtnX-like HAD-IB family phosphatase [candidate division KSB1 bacterium]|nr:MtnX-like HAD-IB family phosphatase [candidate division KSB1 bacterium]
MKIFCDFDGTAAKNDVGNLLFRTFADERCFGIVRSWKEGKISSRECLIDLCEITRVTSEELEQFSNAQELDPYFAVLVEFGQQKNIEVEILSDGLDFYIERILSKYKLDSIVAFHSNHLRFLNQNQIVSEFPYYDQGCGQCANCKGYHVRQAKEKTKPVVYVGDGLSDRCGAKEADIVFAKRGRDLLRYCQQNQIEHHEFGDFKDVLNKIKLILDH